MDEERELTEVTELATPRPATTPAVLPPIDDDGSHPLVRWLRGANAFEIAGIACAVLFIVVGLGYLSWRFL